MKRLAFVSLVFTCAFILIRSFLVSESTDVTSKSIEPVVDNIIPIRTESKPALKLFESFEFNSQQIEDLPEGLAESSFGQSYRELMEINVANRKNVTINFSETIEDVLSVVITGVSGKLLPSSININNGIIKNRYLGQELFEDDWIKIDDFQGKLSSINLDLVAKESGSLKIYIQKRSLQ
jgi:hypothetical protein